MIGKRRLRKLRTHGFIVFASVLALLWQEYDVRHARPPPVYQGVPVARSWVDPNTWFRVLRNDGFTVGYSDLRGNPLWVSYRLARVAENAPNLPRLQRFERDWRN